jgi:MSHA biogenesis protein MshN
VPVLKPRDDRPGAASSAPDKSDAARIEKTDRPYTPEELAENAYREAARLAGANNAPEAERRLKALLAGQPRHVKARELLVSLQLDTGRWLEAQDSLEQGLTQMPEHNAFRYQLARLYLEHGAEAQSLALLERARAEGRSDAELHAFLAALYQRAGRHADATKSYQDALALRPAEGKWWLGLGISLEAQQSNAAARDAYKRALETGRLVANLASYAEDRLKALTTR